MKYIIQIFTGGWHNAGYSAEEIVRRLDHITSLLPVGKVIIGWNTDISLYQEAAAYLKEKGIDILLWLPVFSETGELTDCEEALDIYARPVNSFALQEGESFAFYCPSSARNIQNVIDVYERFFKDIPFDGVFLDKIRTQSFAAGLNGVLSCGCPRCQEIYRRKGLPLSSFRKAYEQRGDHLFDISGYDGSFRFIHPEAEDYFRIKAEIISESVKTLCAYFKEKGMEVGLDLYAPLMAQIVGQDYRAIAANADFIKPMMYRRTEAPAGISFEYNLLKQHLPGSSGWPVFSFDEDFLKEQLSLFKDIPVQKYPGIEINYREDIARTDPVYIKESLTAFRECGMDGAVLSWDAMLAPDSHLKAVREAENWGEVELSGPFQGEAVTEVNGIPLPEQYLAFMKQHNGGEGDLGETWFVLYPLEELQQINDDYEVQKYLPGRVLIGSNGGGEFYGIDSRGNYFNVPESFEEKYITALGSDLEALPAKINDMWKDGGEI